MGFIDLIKGIFAKEPEITEDISLENIDEWFGKKYSSKQDFLKGQIDGIKARIDEGTSSARQNIENLANARLRNPNIPEKAKHFMDGNRSAYMKKTEQFLENIKLPEDIELISGFIADFENRLEEFGKSTARPFTILKEFFEEEALKIAGSIKEIDNVVGVIKGALDNSKLNEMKELRRYIAQLKNRTSHKKFLQEEAAKKEQRVEELKTEITKNEQNISNLENSNEYKDYQMLSHRMEGAKKESAEKESELTHMFASLERPMKKYLRVIYDDKELLQKYIENPIKALMQDLSLKVISIFQNMRKAIVDNTIELKDRQRVKAIEDIRRMDKDFLSKFLTEYAQLKKKENDISRELDSLDVVEKLEKTKENLSINKAMLDKAKNDLERLNSELGKIDIELMKKELSEKIKSATDVTVVIS